MINLNTGRSYPLELIQLDQLLVNILQPYEQHIKQENRTLEVNFCTDIDAFYQYRPPIERILTNLLDNALKFSNLVAVLILLFLSVKKTTSLVFQ